MPNAWAWSAEAEEMLVAEWERAVERDVSHPCVVAWVPVNESMGFPGLEAGHPGQYAFLERVVALTRRLDPHRPVIDNDGWEHTDVTDVVAIHDYTPTGDALRARYRETLQGGPCPNRVVAGQAPLPPRRPLPGPAGDADRGGGFLQRPSDGPAPATGAPVGVDRLFEVYAAVAGGTSYSRATLTSWPAWPIWASWPASATPSSTTCSTR